MTKESELSSVIAASLREAQNARTVRRDHVLLALVSMESFLSSNLTEYGVNKEALAQAITSNTALRKFDQESVVDKLMCAFYCCLHVGIPAYSTAFYHLLKSARKRSRTMKRQVITVGDLCYALLLDEPENSLVHESLKGIGLDPKTMRLALESSDVA